LWYYEIQWWDGREEFGLCHAASFFATDFPGYADLRKDFYHEDSKEHEERYEYFTEGFANPVNSKRYGLLQASLSAGKTV
jgi:hypothetical protein